MNASLVNGKLFASLAMLLLLIVGCQNATVKQSQDEEPVSVDTTAVTSPENEPENKEQVKVISKSTSAKKGTKFNPLTKEEEYILLYKGTERQYTGEYTKWSQKGTFICKRCNAPLYKTDAKFDSHCGWPSFDDEIGDSVERHLDADGSRIEIVCKNCGGHLGHVFEGEGFTAKDTRHCVNSLSIKFVAEGEPLPEVILPE